MVSNAPDAGDIVWMNFTPQAGKEQAGTRPVLVLSPAAYNEKVGLMIVCPIISRSKGYGFEVSLPDGLKVGGVVLSDHVKSVDWKSRGARTVDRVPRETLSRVQAKLETLSMVGH